MPPKTGTVGERLVALETQMARIVSDIESEKGTRERQDTRIEARIVEMSSTLEEKMNESSISRDAKFGAMDTRLSRIEKIILLVTGAGLLLSPLLTKLLDEVIKVFFK